MLHSYRFHLKLVNKVWYYSTAVQGMSISWSPNQRNLHKKISPFLNTYVLRKIEQSQKGSYSDLKGIRLKYCKGGLKARIT